MFDKDYMCMALKIASDNPDGMKSVGCVIVKDGIIVGTGYRATRIFRNQPMVDITIHAEHMALSEAAEKGKGATLYTTLEPCSKRCCYPCDIDTSCCEFIINAGISRVVINSIDNDFGRGGAELLKSNGIEVKLLSNV